MQSGGVTQLFSVCVCVCVCVCQPEAAHGRSGQREHPGGEGDATGHVDEEGCRVLFLDAFLVGCPILERRFWRETHLCIHFWYLL